MSKAKLTTKERTDNSFVGVYKKCNIEIDRDEDTHLFYIIVRYTDGTYMYDGSWPDSENATIDEAIKEAISGAQL
jgi:hypothetical protein